ncbi:beta-ketoacyl synthase N-terminal-like domain-containing protein, partial [Paenibacillus sp. NPDC058910]|uniref:beta-ketoacyl synthase N-terminal-like domain-containing protein n=1 Tax=Paenibacillus sp. NPDC058910 TaxID=3346670 RepID=UPI003695D18D
MMTNSRHSQTATGLEIAVIGMAGRFPEARNIEEYWDNLRNGKESIHFFSDSELEAAGVDPELIRNPRYVRAKGLVPDAEWFDSDFFDYSPREAEVIDPQLRIFHECAYEALEHAGYDTEQTNGAIGLYAGASSSIYWQLVAMGWRRARPDGPLGGRGFWGKDFLVLRFYHNLNLKWT